MWTETFRTDAARMTRKFPLLCALALSACALKDPMPRDESHCWFTVTGEQAPAMLAKLCGVDLRPAKFAAGQIAQTSVAKINAIVIRCPAGEVVAYHLLADSASAEYFWACLIDAMAEFDGKPIGLAAVRRLLGASTLARSAEEGEQKRAG